MGSICRIGFDKHDRIERQCIKKNLLKINVEGAIKKKPYEALYSVGAGQLCTTVDLQIFLLLAFVEGRI